MDYLNDLFDLGDDILKTVTDAIETNNYSGLSNSLKSRIGAYRQEVQDTEAWRRAAENGKPMSGWQTASQRRANMRNEGGSAAWKSGTAAQKQNAIVPFTQAKPSKAGYIAEMATGIAGMAVTGAAGISLALAGIGLGAGGLTAAGIFSLICTGGFGILTRIGAKGKSLVDKFYRYAQMIGDAQYFEVKQLAARSGSTVEETRKNIQSMMKYHMLPNATFDETGQTVMLTAEMREQYQQALEARKQLQLEQSAREKELDSSDITPEARRVLKEGETFIRSLRNSNDLIDDPAMSAKIDQLENIVGRIFRQVKKEPANAVALRKFMNYYLPTTEKLLHAYAELDRQPEVGTNIVNTKKEIEEAIDTINDAFENLLDSLFQDVAWDISSDISVMKTMMAQDGLSGDKVSDASAKDQE